MKQRCQYFQVTTAIARKRWRMLKAFSIFFHRSRAEGDEFLTEVPCSRNSSHDNTQPSGYDWYVTVRPRYVLCPSRIIRKCEGGWCEIEAAQPVFEADTIEECESFLSWINCKFTRFFLVPNISRLTGILTDDCFRFVPAPPSGKFDHIYTDDELYKDFNLPQKYIDVIEAVVKERK